MGFQFQVRGHMSPHAPDSIAIAGDMEHVISCLMMFRWTFRYTRVWAVKGTLSVSCTATFGNKQSGILSILKDNIYYTITVSQKQLEEGKGYR